MQFGEALEGGCHGIGGSLDRGGNGGDAGRLCGLHEVVVDESTDRALERCERI